MAANVDDIKEHIRQGDHEAALRDLETFAEGAGSLPDFQFISNAIEEIPDLPKTYRHLRVAVLRNFTIEPWIPVLSARLFREHIAARIWVGDFDVFEDYARADSDLAQFRPDLIVLGFESRMLLKDLQYLPPRDADGALEGFPELFSRRFERLVAALGEVSSAHIVTTNLAAPPRDFFSPTSHQTARSVVNTLRAVNLALAACAEKTDALAVFDLDYECSRFGLAKAFDAAMWYYAANPFNMQATIAMASALAGTVAVKYRPAKKCVVVDLDNTLWGGILGEDGEQNLKIGTTFPGVLYREFQMYLKGLRQMGVLLAVNSKNNASDCLDFFRTSQDMVLRESDFAALRINWNDKAANMREIAKELNLGLDSFVFIDDSEYECGLIRTMLPEVAVFRMPASAMAIPGFIDDLGCLQNLKILDEDRKRGDYYLAERQRKDFEKSFETMDEYLSRLGMELTIESLEEANVPRVSQLTLKTNQFNLTTRRYQESDIREFLKAGARIYTLRMKDVFGDYGLVGVAILTPRDGATWMFDTFLLSCRVLGRSVETAFTGFCLDELKRAGCLVAVGEYIRSAKNDQVKDFYARMNFVPGDGNDESRTFTFDLVEGGRVPTPAFFALHTRGSGE